MTWIEVWDAYWLTYLGAPGIVARMIERQCARLPQAAAAISEMTRRDLHAIGYRDAVAVIPCGVDLAAIDAVPPATEAIDVLFVGRLIKEKNVDLLIRAIGRIAAAHPRLLCLIVGDGPAKDDLVALTSQLGLADTIHFRPPFQHHWEVFAAMKASRVLVNPSSREGFGIITVEANACGLPVITTNHPRNASRDLVQDGRNGLVCEPTATALAGALDTMLSGAVVAPGACRESAHQYGWETITDTLETFYETGLAMSGRSAPLAAAR
jgi:glycosyltransferase involved in cell wall biosynthesis